MEVTFELVEGPDERESREGDTDKETDVEERICDPCSLINIADIFIIDAFTCAGKWVSVSRLPIPVFVI